MIQKNKDGSANGRPLVSKTNNVGSIPAPSALKINDKKNEKKRIIALANKWFGILNLYHWRITFTFKDEKENLDTAYRPGELKMVDDVWEIAMTTQVDPYYLQARITVWLPVTHEMEDDELEETFLHECCHIIISPISKPSKSKEEELVATSFARAFKNALNIPKNGTRSNDTGRHKREGRPSNNLSDVE